MTIDKARERLSSPFKLQGIACRNRIVRSATNDYRGNPDGSVSDLQLRIYSELAGGAGLLITGNFFISEDGRLDETQPGLLGNAMGPGLRRLTDAVHEKGGAVVAQISHAGRKTKISPENAGLFDSPAKVAVFQIEKLTEAYANSALSARETGFDGIQLHCAHGYLLSDFLDPIRNVRKDEYGGSAYNRARFLLNIVDRVKTLCGPDYPLLIKADATINYNGEWDAKSYAGLFCDYLRIFQQAGIHAVEFSGANLGAYVKTDHNYFERALCSARRAVDLPFILTGGVRSLEDVRYAFEAGADLVGFSRPFIRSPDFAERLLRGEASHCISCNACYKLKERGGRRCALNQASY